MWHLSPIAHTTLTSMRALSAEQRAEREYQKWSKAVKSAQSAVAAYKFTESKVIAKNDSERRRIDAECDARRKKWDDGLKELEQDLDRVFKARPISIEAS